jgi:hypothetical protein
MVAEKDAGDMCAMRKSRTRFGAARKSFDLDKVGALQARVRSIHGTVQDGNANLWIAERLGPEVSDAWDVGAVGVAARLPAAIRTPHLPMSNSCVKGCLYYRGQIGGSPH